MLKPGDRVSIEYYDRRAFGTVTIAREKDSKVIFDGEFDLVYDYYPNEQLRKEEDARTTSEDLHGVQPETRTVESGDA